MTCSLAPDLLAQVHAGRTAEIKISYATISTWLESKGERVTTNSLKYHFEQGHG